MPKPNFIEQRKRRVKQPPLLPSTLDLMGLLGSAIALGRIQLACKRGSMSWAAFYKEKEKLDQECDDFVRRYLK